MFQNPLRLLAHAISAPLGDQDGLMLSERESVNLLCSLPAASATHTSRAPARSLTKAIGGCVARSLPCESPARVSVPTTTAAAAATTRTTICALHSDLPQFDTEDTTFAARGQRPSRRLS